MLLQKIKEQFSRQLPFVCYCKPNSNRMIALLQKNDVLHEWNSLSTGFVLVSFDGESRVLIPENQSDVYFELVSMTDFVFSSQKDFPVDAKAKENFERIVENAILEIEEGTFEKVVLSRKEIVSITNFDFELVFNKLISNYPTAFKYCFYHPKVGFWMGASPEQFLKVEDSFIKTIALAGTQLNTGLENIIWHDKEIKEQQIVTDFIMNNLREVSQSVTKSKPYTFQAGSIVHIKTDIQAELENHSDLQKIIDLLHPTPAVCGFPKSVAKQFILENEGYNRAFYAGFLGEWNKDFLTYKEGNSDLFVNLRCMKITKEHAELYVGCGINEGSIPENEFMETVNKSQTMKKVL